jgi:uncharacterized protein (UPF0335 family)
MGVSTTVSLNGGLEVPLGGLEKIVTDHEARMGALADMRRSQERKVASGRQQEAEEGQFGTISAARLRSLVERIERLEEERKALGSDIKDIFAEAKSAGFDVKVMRQIIRLRKLEPAEVEEQETLLDVYRRALGM